MAAKLYSRMLPLQKGKAMKKGRNVSLSKGLAVMAAGISIICVALLMCMLMPARSAQAKTYNVKKFGAKAGTDSTEAIQKALDEAAKTGKANKPSVVKIPKGTFYINKTLYIGSNTTLKLTKKTIIKKTEKFGLLNMLSIRSGSKGGYKDWSNITVSGGIWDGEFKLFTSTSGGSIFFFAHTTGLKITGAEIRNNFGTHLIELGGVKDCVISDCKLHGFKAKGKDVEKEAIQLDVTHDENILPHGEPFDDTPCENITVRNCEIYDYPRAVGSHMAIEGIVHVGLNVENCKLHDLKAAAVYTFATEGVKVKDCTISNVQIGISFRSGAIGDSSIILKRLPGVKATEVTPGDNDFEGNTITSITDEGIAIYGGSARTKGNTIEDTGKNAVTVSYDSALSMDGDVISRTKSIGISLTNNAKVSVKGAKISDCTKMGIYVGPGCSCEAEETEVVNAGSHGINAVSSEIVCRNVTVTGAGANGYTLMEGATAKITGGTVKGSAKKGISVTKNTKLEADGVTVTGNPNDTGIYAEAGCKLTVTNCTITYNGTANEKYPISCKGADFTEYGNTIYGNGKDRIVQ